MTPEYLIALIEKRHRDTTTVLLFNLLLALGAGAFIGAPAWIVGGFCVAGMAIWVMSWWNVRRVKRLP